MSGSLFLYLHDGRFTNLSRTSARYELAFFAFPSLYDHVAEHTHLGHNAPVANETGKLNVVVADDKG